MMRSWSSVIAYLDLMCCGFGGALLLLLIVSTCQPQPAAGLSGRLMIVRVATAQGSLPEIRLSCLRPHRSEWESINTLKTELGDQLFAFQADAMPGSGGETVWAIQNPVEGVWEFRVNLITFARNLPATPARLELTALGDGIALAEDFILVTEEGKPPVAVLQPLNQGGSLLWPGDFSKPVRVWVNSNQDSD